MRVLVGCEESQVVTKAFRKNGNEAFSCDIVDTRGRKDWHIKGDIMDNLEGWDLIILHPPCTYMAVSGNRWYAGTEERKRDEEWTLLLWNRAKLVCNKVALENPVSTIWKKIPCAQYIQPWQFGHGESKRTGFALYNLPPLEETKVMAEREPRVWKMAPSKTRSRDRSVTYQGIADAMADQWGK